MLEDGCERLDVISNGDKIGKDNIRGEGERRKISARNQGGKELGDSIAELAV